MKNYTQLTLEERYLLGHYKSKNTSISEIARILGRDKATISREIKRNSCHRTDGAYRPTKADARAKARRGKSRRYWHYTKQEWKLVIDKIKELWSPEQISIRFKKKKTLNISHETIYRYIWEDKRHGGSLYKYLRQAKKLRRKRHNSKDSRGRKAGKLMIEVRPKHIEYRRNIGHWEIDTVMGKGSKDCIVTIVERMSGYTLIGKLNDRTTDTLNKRTIALIDAHIDRFETITADNGTEFNQYENIEEKTGVTFYFANPYHSWERGTNENTNGLIRQYLPKGESMASLTQAKCNAIAKKLNQRPRKRLNGLTPEEVFYG
ncbi:MAG: IS30 family transposase [Pseudomonadales bacterium]|nr:IS30 family transposase [Pseudomonadales bacterium]